MNLLRFNLFTANLALAAGMTAGAFFADRFPGDLDLALAIQDLPGGPFQQVMEAGDLIGDTAPLILIGALMVLALMLRSHFRASLFVLFSSAWFVFSPWIKGLVERPRPDPELVDVLVASDGFAYPSGHAFGATLVFGAAILLADRLAGGRWLLGWMVRIVALAVLAAVLLSRVYLGLHWPSDVLGGLSIAMLGLATFLRVIRPLGARSRGAA